MISVCMATYNGERYLKEQVDSILKQLDKEDELIISDDGSTDKTLQILDAYGDRRIKILHNQEHGVNGNFENALRHAVGDYIFLSDQDDIWLPGKVKACVEVLQSADCVVHDCIVVNAGLKEIEPSFFATRSSGPGFWKNLYKNGYLGCCMAFKRDVLKYALPYPHNLPIFQEGWIASLADIKGVVKFIDFKGILFRRHESNASFTAKKSGFTLTKKISYRGHLLWLIAKRLLKIG